MSEVPLWGSGIRSDRRRAIWEHLRQSKPDEAVKALEPMSSELAT